MERAFGVEDEASIELRVRRNAARFESHEVDVDQVVQTALDRLGQFCQPMPRLSLVLGAGKQKQGVARPAQHLEQGRRAIVAYQRPGVGSLLTGTWAGREACLSKMA